MNILELYSGIGGMHLALIESGIDGQIKASVDINTVANEIYKHNFPEVPLKNLNINGLTSSFINSLNANTVLMSPPCQPFTRNGLLNDTKDARTSSFLHFLDLLPDIPIENILIENVKGFESSEMRNILIKTLTENDFVYQEFLLSPTNIGIPNSRLRYYCLGKRKPLSFSFEPGKLMQSLPQGLNKTECFHISEILDKDCATAEFLVPEIILKRRAKVLDICHKDSRRSCCFTKAYGRYVEGTGSVYTDKTEEDINLVFREIENLDNESDEYMKLLRTLSLRFFTPKEICRLMSFPQSFGFPNNITLRQKYMVLGNSVNVKIVSELIKLLQ